MQLCKIMIIDQFIISVWVFNMVIKTFKMNVQILSMLDDHIPNSTSLDSFFYEKKSDKLEKIPRNINHMHPLLLSHRIPFHLVSE